jgi:hypothetical protein
MEALKGSYDPEARPKIEALNSRYGSYWLLPLDSISRVSQPAVESKAWEGQSLSLSDPGSPTPAKAVLKLKMMNKDNKQFEGRVRNQSLLVVCFDLSQPLTLESAKSKVSRGSAYPSREN